MKQILLSLIALFIIGNVVGQNLTDEDKKTFEKGMFYVDLQQPYFAYPFFDTLAGKYPDNIDIQYTSGLVFLEKADQRKRALNVLHKVEEMDANYKDLKFWKGKGHMEMYEFPEAIEYLQDYQNGPETKQGKKYDLKESARRLVENCENAIALTKNPIDVTIKLLEPPSTIEGSQYVPVITPDEKVLIYTNRGPGSKGGIRSNTGDAILDRNNYFEDVFLSNQFGDTLQFEDGDNISNSINTLGHDAAVSISADGRTLVLYKSDDFIKDDLYISKKSGKNWSFPKPIDGINTKNWEGHATLSANGEKMYFSSNRPGGYGGRDIWYAEKVDGKWTNVRNAGPTINTEYNEDACFLHPSGKIMFYSSEGFNSMGGYDIFYTTTDNDSGNWVEPINIGHPINTVDDDRYFVLSGNGRHGYFSSARASLGLLHDIFIINMRTDLIAVPMAQLVGQVTVDKKPVEVMMRLYDNKTKEFVGAYQSDYTDGAYSFYLEPNKEYRIEFTSADGVTYNEVFTVPNITEFLQVRHDFALFTAQYQELYGKKKIKPLDLSVQEATETYTPLKEVPEEKQLPTKSKTDDHLRYKVTLGEYPPGKFDPSCFSEYGTVETVKLDNGKILYKIGGFATKEEAEKLRKRLMVQKKCFVELKQIQAIFDLSRPVDIDMTTIELGRYENPEDFDQEYWSKYGEVYSVKTPDGKTLFFLGSFEDELSAQAVLAKLKADPNYGVKSKGFGIIPLPEEFDISAPYIVLDDIYYDFDKYNIRNRELEVTNHILEVLRAHPNIVVQLSSHTDSRGSHEYNVALSRNRSLSAQKWFAARKIKSDRLKVKWFGETQLTNRCADGVPCSPDEHQANRRTEVDIIEF